MTPSTLLKMGAAKAIQITRRRQIPSKHITVGGTALPAPLMVPESISVAMYVMKDGAVFASGTPEDPEAYFYDVLIPGEEHVCIPREYSVDE